MEIDIVYLWVDGSDPVWQERRANFMKGRREGSGTAEAKKADGTNETNCKGRWADNDELRYSLRSAEKFAPWIRRVFIVTDGQTPEWLETSNPRVRIVDHAEIMPPETRPCFNASVIEHYLHKIPGLADRFLFANDDMFFGAPVEPVFFFEPDGRPIVRLKPKMLGKLRFIVKKELKVGFGYYRRMLFRSARLVEEKTGNYLSGIPHHNIDAYVLDDYRLVVEDVFRDEVFRSQGHHTRTEGDFHRSAIALWALATGRAQKKYVTDKNESLRIGVHKPDYMGVMRRHSPRLFCLNDSQRATDDDRTRIRPFLESLFPEPSSFEKA